MDERKDRPAHERLYATGKAKLRAAARSQQVASSGGSSPERNDKSAGERGSRRLYELHKDKKEKAAAKLKQQAEAKK